jgi:uncharacterized membrane protein
MLDRQPVYRYNRYRLNHRAVSPSTMNKVMSLIRRYFVSGVLVVVPVILTYLVLKFLFEAIDGILKPVIIHVFGYYVPLLGIVTLLLIILLVGVIVRSYIGHELYSLGDRLLTRIPLIRPVYSAAKQLLEAITGPSVSAFKEVALIEYPRRGTWAMCFICNRVRMEIAEPARQCAVVFVPSTPTPISGMVVLTPLDEVYPVDMTIEEGVKFLVSGGVASPSLIKQKAQTLPTSQNEGIIRETC